MEFVPVSMLDFERYILVLARVVSIFVTMPFLGSVTIPIQVKIGVAAAISLAMFPVAAPDTITTALSFYQLSAVALGELMIGLSMGLLARLFLVAIDLGSEAIGFQMGYGIVTAVDPSTQAQSSLISQFQGVIAVLMILATNTHHFFFLALGESFRRIPLMGFGPTNDLWNLFLETSGQIFVLALKFAAPTMVVLMLTNVALGIVARTVPQMNIFMVGLTVQIVMGFTILFVSVSMMGLAYKQTMFQMGTMLFRFVRAF